MKHLKTLLLVITIAFNCSMAQTAMSPARKQQIKKAKKSEDLLQITQFIKLELTNESILGVIQKALKIKNHWFVLDQSSGSVLQFREDGSFVRTVGGIGQGPTEYLLPTQIEHVYNDQLLVLDSRGGRMLLYDENGDFQTRYDFRQEFGLNPEQVVWRQPERLFFGWTHGMSTKPTPEHAIFTYEQGIFKQASAFSTTNPRILKNQKPQSIKLSGGGFAVIQNHIWSGSPYEAHIVMYDLSGRRIKTLSRPHAEQITLDQVLEKDFTNIKDVRSVNQAVRNRQIIPVGDLVLAPIRKNRQIVLDIYDQEGEHLNSGITFTPFAAGVSSQEDRLITYLPTLLNVQQHKDLLGEHAFELLTSAGFDPDNYEDQNNFLMIFTLVR